MKFTKQNIKDIPIESAQPKNNHPYKSVFKNYGIR